MQKKKAALSVVTNVSNVTNATNQTSGSNTTQANETIPVAPTASSNDTGEEASHDNRESTMRNQDKDKTFFLPPKPVSEKEKPSWKNPFPDRIGSNVNGTWVIPNITVQGNTTFKNVSETNTSVESNTTVIANGTTASNSSSEHNTTSETNVSAESNVTSAQTLIQIKVYNESNGQVQSDEVIVAPRPPTVKGHYYDAEDGFYPDPAAPATPAISTLIQLSEEPAVEAAVGPPHLSSGYYTADGGYIPPVGAGINSTNNEKPDPEGIATARVNLTVRANVT